MVLKPDQIQAIYHLSQAEQWSIRKISYHLGLDRQTVRKYALRPVIEQKNRQRKSKLDPFRLQIQQWLAQDPKLSGQRILDRLHPLGYPGGHSILDVYLSQVRPRHQLQVFVRVEVPAGEQFQVDWADCGQIDYGGARRRLYAFALLEAHSRLLYLEFTHAMTLATLCRCHLHAFQRLNGVAREVLFDNMRTVVRERNGTLVGFNLLFLDFARQLGFVPKVCQVASPWQKGKIERAIGYVKSSFLDGRPPFPSLEEANRQARIWLDEVANHRLHRETRQKPAERFQPKALKPLPSRLPDCRDAVTVLASPDLRVSFDGNRYGIPARWAGCPLLLKADSSSVTLFDQDREIVCHPRCWGRGASIGVERFEQELLESRPRALYSTQTNRLVQHLGPLAEAYLKGLAAQGFALEKQVSQLLELVRRYEADPVRLALEKALQAQAWGADYITNILHQQANPRTDQPPVPLKNPELAQLAPDPISLLEYDTFIFHEKETDS
jgi:transposase